jgi:chromosome segregation ATPase
MPCKWETDAFKETLADFNDVQRGIETSDRRIDALDHKHEAWSHSIATLKDDLYYLDQNIIRLGQDRSSLNDKLDFTKEDDEQRRLNDQISVLDGQIRDLRQQQQDSDNKLRDMMYEQEAVDRERLDVQREKDHAIQELERIRRTLHDILARVRVECGSEMGLVIP